MMKVSILSPVFNEQDHLDEMISSVRAQTHQDWELLFVDDGSTDATSMVIEKYERVDGRIQLLGQGRKLGKVAAFNVAFAASSGEAVVLLAGDDRLPPRSLEIRAEALRRTGPMGLGLFKIKTFSTDPRVDGMVLPRGRRVSASGGVMAIRKDLGSLIFPIPEVLPAEDIWLRHAALALASRVERVPEVVLEYRIHSRNSNPRRLDFEVMSERMAARYAAWALLAASDLPMSPADRVALQRLADVEELRQRARILEILLAHDVPLSMRLSQASAGSRLLYRFRSRLYRNFSGWIGH